MLNFLCEHICAGEFLFWSRGCAARFFLQRVALEIFLFLELWYNK